ncbi:hypothetical protein Tco_1504974 [Tanacetum coccineum]
MVRCNEVIKIVPVLVDHSCLPTSLRKYSSSTRLLHEPFINLYVRLANNSGVRVSTLSQFITNAEKSRGVSISSLNDSRGSSF